MRCDIPNTFLERSRGGCSHDWQRRALNCGSSYCSNDASLHPSKNLRPWAPRGRSASGNAKPIAKVERQMGTKEYREHDWV